MEMGLQMKIYKYYIKLMREKKMQVNHQSLWSKSKQK